jgi:hypothetical protein
LLLTGKLRLNSPFRNATIAPEDNLNSRLNAASKICFCSSVSLTLSAVSI